MKNPVSLFAKSLMTVILCFSVSYVYSADAQTLEDTFVELSQNAGPAVVTITVVQTVGRGMGQQGMTGDPMMDEFFYRFFGGRPQEYKQKGMGSGFILDKDGHILTNDHVVGNADEIEVTLPDGRNFKAELLGSDPKSDIALIKIKGDNLPFLKLGDSDQVKPGQWALAMGNPFGNIVNNPKPTITAGIVSAVHRTINIREEDRMYGDLIQTDAAINQGNSGGPLVNLKGEVIGINTLIFSPSGGSVGIGFAIPINRGKAILQDLISGREIRHGWLGLWLQDVSMEMVRQFGLSTQETGALVFKVEKGSPGEAAGFESGDIILEINEQRIVNTADVTRIVSGKRPGEKLQCRIFRSGAEKKIQAEIGERKEGAVSRPSVNRQDAHKIEWRGLQVEDITDEMVKTYNLPSKEGVIVSKVIFGSPAFNARISAGDVIYSIAQNPVNSSEDFQRIAPQHTQGDVLVHTSRGYVVIYDQN